jgi:hypothetical protein
MKYITHIDIKMRTGIAIITNKTTSIPQPINYIDYPFLEFFNDFARH